MQKHRSKSIIAITIVLTLTMAALFVSVPASAKQYPDRTVKCFMATSPKLVGVGQTMTMNLMVWPALEGPTMFTPTQITYPGRIGDFDDETVLEAYRQAGFWGLTVTFTRPDGTKDTFMPQDVTMENLGILIPGLTQNMGTLLFYYQPNMAGEWSAQFTYPGQTLNNEWYSTLSDTVTYLPSTSQVSYFTVQEAPVVECGLLNGWPWSPLPENYWERPVDINNREWAMISGNWCFNSYDGNSQSYNMYSMAPESSHILWKNNWNYGGIVGGEWGSWSYNTKVTRSGAPLIWDGKVYHNEPNVNFFQCHDLRTGELLWRSPGTISHIQMIRPFFQTPAQTEGVQGTIQPYIVDTSGGTWKFRDPLGQGTILRTINNPASGISSISWQTGSMDVYMYQRADWNTTLPLAYAKYNVIKWNLEQVTGNDWKTGIVWNTTIARAPGEYLPGDNTRSGFGRFDYQGVIVLCAAMDPKFIGFDMETGAELWRKDYEPQNWIPTNLFYCQNEGIVLCMDTEIAGYHAIDVKTGNDLWTTSPPMMEGSDWQGMACYYEFVIANGNFYVGAYDGHCYAFSLTDGHMVWKSDYIGDTTETIYNTWVFCASGTQAGAAGKLFMATGTVYGVQPQSRFNKLACIDEMTGKFDWVLDIGGTAGCGAAIAEGYYIYSGEIGNYQCFGKGQTETTVSVQNDVVAKGSSVLIKGTVMDISPAQPGTPAVAEQDMEMWMNYLHTQNAEAINSPPPQPNGVPVKLYAIDPNGNMQDIGTVTTDSMGLFTKLWTPPIEGEYRIVASFERSASYWSSVAETAIGVGPAAAASGQITPEQPTAETPFITTEIAIIAAIAVAAVIGVASFWMLRKRK